MQATDFFEYEEPTWPDEYGQDVLNTSLLDELCAGAVANHPDQDVAAGLLDLVHDELQAYGTSGEQRLTNDQIRLAVTTLQRVTTRLGMPVRLPFRDFTTFRSYWVRNKASGSGSWQARRDILEGLLNPSREKLERLAAAARPELPEVSLASLRDPAAIQEHLTRIQRNITDDPPAAIGSAKELIESTAKTVLLERGWPVNDKDDVPALTSQAHRALAMHPQSVAPGPDSSEAIKRILGAMITTATSLSELRNRSGTGHGQSGKRVGLGPRHGHLAVNAAITWCQLMLDTLADPDAPWRKSPPEPTT